MSNIRIREEKMKEKRKQTPWRDFLKEIASRINFTVYKNGDLISRFPVSDRIKVILQKEYDKYTNVLVDIDVNNTPFFQLLKELNSKIP